MRRRRGITAFESRYRTIVTAVKARAMRLRESRSEAECVLWKGSCLLEEGVRVLPCALTSPPNDKLRYTNLQTLLVSSP